MTANMLRFRSQLIGTHLNTKEWPLIELPGAKKYSANKTESEEELYRTAAQLMDDAIAVYKNTIKNGYEVASVDQQKERYLKRNKAFSILAPCRERTQLSICHGSHRWQHKARAPSKGEKNQTIHRALMTDIFIPENCYLILDENLIHAGTGSMISGYSPVHSPRYFTYVHHKDYPIHDNISFRYFDECDPDCAFCNDKRLLAITDQLKCIFDTLDTNVMSMAMKCYKNDWVAGDLVTLGWVIFRNGVVVDDHFERRLGHEFQTLLLTKKMIKYSPNSSWAAIDTWKKTDLKNVMEGTCRTYLYKNDSGLRPNVALTWGSRKMIPYQDDEKKNRKASNLDWFANNGCEFIAKFFLLMEENLTKTLTIDECGDCHLVGKSFLTVVSGVEDCVFKDYVFSGQCVIANFGFVRRQNMHMDYYPILYDLPHKN